MHSQSGAEVLWRRSIYNSKQIKQTILERKPVQQNPIFRIQNASILYTNEIKIHNVARKVSDNYIILANRYDVYL